MRHQNKKQQSYFKMLSPFKNFIGLFFLKFYYVYLLCVVRTCMHLCVYMQGQALTLHTCEGLKTTYERRFTPFPCGSRGLNLGHRAWLAKTFTL